MADVAGLVEAADAPDARAGREDPTDRRVGGEEEQRVVDPEDVARVGVHDAAVAHHGDPLAEAFHTPGREIQRLLATREPTPEQLQVGVAALAEILRVEQPAAEDGEPPPAAWYRVPSGTARQVHTTHARGGRGIAVGTTVARALESAADPSGQLVPDEGWTELVLGPDRAPRVVDGLITGWHEPDASHLLLLEAVAGTELVGRAYAAALAARYRWHEFGDSCLLLPGRRRPT